MDKEIRSVPFKNYIVLGIVIVVTLLLLYYFYMWVDIYKESKINIPIMDKYMDVINYKELDNYLVENPNAILYVSVLDNEEIREFEKKLKNEYKNKKIANDVLYMNLTSYLDDKSVMNSLSSLYYVNDISITDVPCILIFSSGNLKSIYSISNNNYDVDKVVSFINSFNIGEKSL